MARVVKGLYLTDLQHTFPSKHFFLFFLHHHPCFFRCFLSFFRGRYTTQHDTTHKFFFLVAEQSCPHETSPMSIIISSPLHLRVKFFVFPLASLSLSPQSPFPPFFLAPSLSLHVPKKKRKKKKKQERKERSSKKQKQKYYSKNVINIYRNLITSMSSPAPLPYISLSHPFPPRPPFPFPSLSFPCPFSPFLVGGKYTT